MKPVILASSPVSINQLLGAIDPAFLKTPSIESAIKKLAVEMLETLRPIAIYGIENILSVESDRVNLKTITLDGVIVTDNLSKVDRIFPFVVSCGIESDRWCASNPDYTKAVLAHELLHRSLYIIMDRLCDEIKRAYSISTISIMNPGSLRGWDISEQKKILALLTPLPEQSGISISESHIISPAMSLSGILYESEKEFLNCMLCPREDCPLRRRPLDNDMYTAKYGIKIK